MAGDGESETESALPVRDPAGTLPEAIEDIGQQRFAHSAARIADLDHRVPFLATYRDADPATFGRELDGVGDHVPNDLLNADRIGGDVQGISSSFDGEGDLSGLCTGAGQRYGGAHDGVEVEGPYFQTQLPGGDP